MNRQTRPAVGEVVHYGVGDGVGGSLCRAALVTGHSDVRQDDAEWPVLHLMVLSPGHIDHRLHARFGDRETPWVCHWGCGRP
jgi:hypothetical protein